MPIKKKTVLEPREILEEIVCDKCGSNMSTGSGQNYSGKYYISYLGLVAHLSCGYDSKLGDGNEIDFCLCENCLIELFKTFPKPVQTRNRIDEGEII
jgi:hypothetical protein